jgi:type II secretory pathway pseudopilin PulG
MARSRDPLLLPEEREVFAEMNSFTTTLSSFRCKTCHPIARSPARRAITLVEVVVGLSLMATLLTGILVVAGRFEKQRRISQNKLPAIEILDQLLAEFFSKGFPILSSEGIIDTDREWHWKVAEASIQPSEDTLMTVRVSIAETHEAERQLAYVDVLVPTKYLVRPSP